MTGRWHGVLQDTNSTAEVTLRGVWHGGGKVLFEDGVEVAFLDGAG